MIAIRFENTTYSYDGKRNALDELTLEIEEGSFTCVLGGNGSGKSTLAKHVNALLVPDSGEVLVFDLKSSDPNNTFSIRKSAGMVFQNPDDQIVASVIEDDVAFGPENMGVPMDDLRTRVTESLKHVGLQGFERKQTAALSGGQKQRVAVAGILAMQPRLIVFDEASSMLDPRGRKGLLRLCKELNDEGLTIVLITHFMDEAALADRVVVLDGGRVAFEGTPEQVFSQTEALGRLSLETPFPARMSYALQQKGVDVPICMRNEELVSHIVSMGGIRLGSEEQLAANDEQLVSASERALSSEKLGEPLVSFENVSFTYQKARKERRRSKKDSSRDKADWGRSPDDRWAVRDISMQIRAGEYFGIAGHTGSGKSTLVQLANGILKPSEGIVRVMGKDISEKKASLAARTGVGVVFQYPERQLFAATVYEDVAFGPRNLGLDSDEVEDRVRNALGLVGLDFDAFKDRNPFTLSGGQQRRAAIAGVLAMQPEALLLDEPTAGLDPKSRRAILALIEDLHDSRGMTIVVVSHNMNDLARYCDRIAVLENGKLWALGSPADVFGDEEALRAIGLGVPDAVHLAGKLDAAGFHVSPNEGLVTEEELVARIARRLEA